MSDRVRAALRPLARAARSAAAWSRGLASSVAGCRGPDGGWPESWLDRLSDTSKTPAGRHWPVAPDRSIVTCEGMMNPSGERAEGYNPKDAGDLWHTVNQQDWHICELSHAGIASRAYVPGPYSPRESVPAAWDREYLARMSDGMAPRA